MKRDFSFYEFTGVFLPGATLLLGLSFSIPEIHGILFSDKFTASVLSLFLIAGYVLGHLIQSVGNLLEKIVWAFRGMPSTWIRRKTPAYLSDAQTKRLPSALHQLTGLPIHDLANLDIRSCNGIRGQLYARLEDAGKTARIDTFNGNYGMFRGIAAALAIVLAVAICKTGIRSGIVEVASISFLLALFRMHRFGVHYAAELYRQALNLAEKQKEERKI
jgi:hypothetical protein